jgi:hypothetical protein
MGVRFSVASSSLALIRLDFKEMLEEVGYVVVAEVGDLRERPAVSPGRADRRPPP